MDVVGKLEVFYPTFRWEIKNFSSLDIAIAAKVRSPVFDTRRHPRSEKLQRQLVFFPGGCDEGSKEYMGLSLVYLGQHPVSMIYSFSILDDKNGKVAVFTSGKQLSFIKNQYWGTKKFRAKALIRDEEKRALINDTITISCTVTYPSIVSGDHLHYNANDSVTSHHDNLLQSGVLSDITFEIGQEKMRLHKVIVSSLSPVFFAMFQHQMREKEESVVQISDVKYEVMKELFRYIYVRKVNSIEIIASDLLVAADKYDVQGLKTLCEDVLSRGINVDNALQHLELAVKYNAAFLKSKATEFVVSRLGEFVDKPEFKKMDGSCKDELFCAIAKNKVKNDT